MRTIDAFVQRVLDEARGPSSALYRSGRRSAVLGAALLVASTATVLATATNTAPQLTNLTSNASVVEVGQKVIVTGSITDPDAGDTHTIIVHWDEHVGIPDRIQRIQLPAGQTSFEVAHVYSAPLAPTDIGVAVEDHPISGSPNDNSSYGARDNKYLTIEVKAPAPANFPPHFDPSTIYVSKSRIQRGIVTVKGDWVDTDPDAGEVTFVSSEGRGPLNGPACTTQGRHFECIHQYRVPAGGKTYPYELHLDDGHGGTDVYRSTIEMR